MLVMIGEKARQMSRGEYEKVRDGIAKQQVPFGIYAIEKAGKAELRRDHCSSMAQLKALARQFKAQGYKVLANRGG